MPIHSTGAAPPDRSKQNYSREEYASLKPGRAEFPQTDGPWGQPHWRSKTALRSAIPWGSLPPNGRRRWSQFLGLGRCRIGFLLPAGFSGQAIVGVPPAFEIPRSTRTMNRSWLPTEARRPTTVAKYNRRKVSGRSPALHTLEVYMKLHVDIEEIESVAVLRLSGDLTREEGPDLLYEQVVVLLGGGKKNVLINLERVERVDSYSLGVIAKAFAAIENQGGEMRLVARGHERRPAGTTICGPLADKTYDNEAEALRSLP